MEAFIGQCGQLYKGLDTKGKQKGTFSKCNFGSITLILVIQMLRCTDVCKKWCGIVGFPFGCLFQGKFAILAGYIPVN